ncbi:MAG: hypothetical protein P4L69_13065 [Desulfosporosinus sp.]|nr:hypothetical protein [Desulfosporosinus sp.]
MKEGVPTSNLKSKLATQLSKSESLDESGNEVLVLVHEQDVERSQNSPIISNPVEVVPEFALTFTEAKNRLLMLKSFVQELMIPGVDYGIIPGCPKPSLLKSGAEKLCDIYGFSKLIAVSNRFEDWQEGFFSYEVKATLINKRTGLVEAEGVGNCNSKERKYRNQDAYSISNTILKMAKKRAIVDAVLSATRSSGIFSQDIEDHDFKGDKSKSNGPSPLRVLPIDKPVSKQQLKDIFTLVNDKLIPIEKAKSLMIERYKLDESRKLTSSQANDFLDYLRKFGHVKLRNA